MNLKQVESGMDGNVGKALRQTYRSPTSILSMFSDVTEAEREASRHNQSQIEYIQQEMEQTRGRLEYKLEWEFSDSDVSKSKIKDIGLNLGFEFPEDYIECVKTNGGASVFPDAFDVGNVEKCFGTLFSFDEKSSENIVENSDIYKRTLPEKLFPIADDPAGNLICFDYKDHEDNPIVVFWEHENAGDKEMLMREKGLTEEQVEERARENVFYITDTFTDFLNKLYD